MVVARSRACFRTGASALGVARISAFLRTWGLVALSCSAIVRALCWAIDFTDPFVLDAGAVIAWVFFIYAVWGIADPLIFEAGAVAIWFFCVFAARGLTDPLISEAGAVAIWLFCIFAARGLTDPFEVLTDA